MKLNGYDSYECPSDAIFKATMDLFILLQTRSLLILLFQLSPLVSNLLVEQTYHLFLLRLLELELCYLPSKFFRLPNFLLLCLLVSLTLNPPVNTAGREQKSD